MNDALLLQAMKVLFGGSQLGVWRSLADCLSQCDAPPHVWRVEGGLLH